MSKFTKNLLTAFIIFLIIAGIFYPKLKTLFKPKGEKDKKELALKAKGGGNFGDCYGCESNPFG